MSHDNPSKLRLISSDSLWFFNYIFLLSGSTIQEEDEGANFDDQEMYERLERESKGKFCTHWLKYLFKI